MDIKKEDLEKRYQALTDEEILKIFKSGGLTDIASKVLVGELRRRRLTDKRIHYKKTADVDNEKSNQEMETKKAVELIEKECPCCKTKFITRRKNQKFCGPACQKQYKSENVRKTALRNNGEESNGIEIKQATWTEDEIKRWLMLRALEWVAFPAYISQPLAPIMCIFFPWYWVIATVVVLGILWSLIRYSYVNVTIANIAYTLVVWAKWPCAIGSAIYLFLHHQPVPGLVALFWPLLGGLIGVPGKVGVIELAFAKKIGFVPQDAEL